MSTNQSTGTCGKAVKRRAFCQDLRRAIPVARPLLVPFREVGGGMRASIALAPAAVVRRALLDSMRLRSDDAADPVEVEAPRLEGASTGASSASLRFLLAFFSARAASPLAHSSRAWAVVPGSSARSKASSVGRPYFALRLLSASTRACSTFFSARKRLRTRWEWAYGSSL
jgi:hypothetical protein